jgi:hypothetical protein
MNSFYFLLCRKFLNQIHFLRHFGSIILPFLDEFCISLSLCNDMNVYVFNVMIDTKVAGNRLNIVSCAIVCHMAIETFSKILLVCPTYCNWHYLQVTLGILHV